MSRPQADEADSGATRPRQHPRTGLAREELGGRGQEARKLDSSKQGAGTAPRRIAPPSRQLLGSFL